MIGKMASKKNKWYWIAGTASALLFVTLLALRLDLFRDTEPFHQGKSDLSSRSSSPRDSWMSISQGGNKIGYAHRNLSATELGYHLSESVFMRINTMGSVQAVKVLTESDLNPDMTVLSFSFSLQSSLFRFSARGTIKDKTLTLLYGTPTAEQKIDMVLKEKPHLAGGLLEAAWGSNMKAGQSRTFHVFDPASMGQRPVVVSMLEEEDITIMGMKQRARKMSVDFMGARQFAWVDRDGTVLREEGMLGIRMEKSTREQAMEGLASSASADLTDMVSLPSNIPIADPAGLKTLRVKLHDVETGKLNLDGDRQSFRNNTLIIRKESLSERQAPGQGTAGDIRDFLKATPFIQSGDLMIREKAREITAHGNSPAVKAGKIVDWVYRHIEKRPVLSVPNALETLINHVGDCNEHAVLVAALARAVGIPAQVEAGLVYQRGRFYYHAWNALYTGRWITADATLNQMPADVTHIRLVRGEAEQQLDLMGVIGKIKLEVLAAD